MRVGAQPRQVFRSRLLLQMTREVTKKMRNVSLLRALWLLAGVLLISSAGLAQVSVGVSVRIGPPALPVYEQPACPGDGFIWIPGYWAWGPEGYFWVPGTW